MFEVIDTTNLEPRTSNLKLQTNPHLLINKTHQPGRPDHQELDVFEERWFFAFYFMTIELPDPGHHKNDHTEKPEGHDAGTFDQVAEPETENCKQQHTNP